MIVIFGPAGSGKSLQGQTLAEKHGWEWLSVGQLLRDLKDPEVDKDLAGGELFDDEFVTKLMHDAMRKAKGEGKDVVLDGYPRDEWQVKKMIADGDAKEIDLAIVLEVPEDELWKRLEGRDRSDDREKIVRRRWEIFEQNICSILSNLETEGVKIERIDGSGTVEEVTARIEQIVSELNLAEGVEAWDDDEWDEEKSYGE